MIVVREILADALIPAAVVEVVGHYSVNSIKLSDMLIEQKWPRIPIEGEVFYLSVEYLNSDGHVSKRSRSIPLPEEACLLIHSFPGGYSVLERCQWHGYERLTQYALRAFRYLCRINRVPH